MGWGEKQWLITERGRMPFHAAIYVHVLYYAFSNHAFILSSLYRKSNVAAPTTKTKLETL